MNRNSLPSRTAPFAFAGALLAAAGLHGQTTPPLENFVEVGGGGAWVDGDTAAFQYRQKIARNGYGGVTGLLYTKTSGDNTVTIEGHALAGANDNLLSIDFHHGEKLGVKLFYREFRTWYDTSDDYIPYAKNFSVGQPWMGFDKGFATDRTEFSLEGVFKPSETLTLQLKYTRTEREGDKASLINGATNLTLIPQIATVSAGPQRNMLGSFYRLNEKRDIVEGSADLTLGSTTLGAGLRWEQTKTDDGRYWRMNPFETSAANPGRYLTQKDGSESDLFAFRATDINRLTDILVLTAGYSYTKLTNDLAGSRVSGPTFDATFSPTFRGPSSRGDSGYYNLTGQTQEKLQVGNLAVMYTPTEHLTVVPSLRVSRTSQDSVADWMATTTATSATPTVPTERIGATSQTWDEIVGGIESRYTGLAGWVFTARADSNRSKGDITKANPVLVTAPLVPEDTVTHRDNDRVALNASWYYSPRMSLTVLYSLDWRKETYEPENPAVIYMRKRSLERENWSGRITLRPEPGVVYVLRYDVKDTSIRNASRYNPLIEAGNLRTKLLSQTLTWTPLSWLYVQGSLNHVTDTLDTPASELSNPLVGTTVIEGTIRDGKNNYWAGSLSVGLVADDKTDVTFSYDRNSADNWYDNSAVAVPYGSSFKDNLFRVSATRRLSDNVRLTAEYGYAKTEDVTSGGHNDFTAHLVMTKLQYRF